MPRILDTLPTEILFEILHHVAFETTFPPVRHPLDTLAATNRLLHAVVEDCTRRLLLKRANIKRPQCKAKAKAFIYRRRWLKLIAITCQLCDRPSRRKAILEAGMTCCKGCDNKKYPKMVSYIFLITFSFSRRHHCGMYTCVCGTIANGAIV